MEKTIYMEESIYKVFIMTLVLFAFVALPVHRALADNETDELEFRVEGPLDAADCTAQTISVLGFTIGVAQAQITGGSTGTCADLSSALSQTVDVRLASDITSAGGKLRAGRVDIKGNSNNLNLKSAIQAIAGKTITLFGRNVNFGGAVLQGLDDKGIDTVPADFSQLVVGQFVKVKLDPAGLPAFDAKEVEVENFTNEIEVELLDDNGVDFNDPVDDVDIEVRDHVVVRVPAPAAPLDTAAAKRSVTRKYHTSSNGSFKLQGLFTGEAKLIIEREHDGKRTRATRVLRIKGDRIKHEIVRLHRVHH